MYEAFILYIVFPLLQFMALFTCSFFIQMYFMSCIVKFDESIIWFESVIYIETKIVYLEKFYLSSS